MGSINELLRPELEREGAIQKNKSLLARRNFLYCISTKRSMRFQDTDGQQFFLYTACGEQSIGIFKLKYELKP